MVKLLHCLCVKYVAAAKKYLLTTHLIHTSCFATLSWRLGIITLAALSRVIYTLDNTKNIIIPYGDRWELLRYREIESVTSTESHLMWAGFVETCV